MTATLAHPAAPAVVVSHTEDPRTNWADLTGWFQRQWDAYYLAKVYKYLLYGGAKGPGKSYFARWYLLRFLLDAYYEQGLRNVRVMLASGSYPTLRERQINKVMVEFPDWLGYYHETQKEFRLYPEYGSGVLCLRNLAKPAEYAGSEFGAIVVEELTEHPLDTFNDLVPALRWPGIDRTSFVGVTNPTGPGALWVRKMWIEGEFTEEQLATGVETEFCFLPALPKDNPHLDQSYWDYLNALPPILAKAWVKGDWYAGISGQVYPQFTHEHVDERAEYNPKKGPVYWMVDDGFGQENPRVILWCQQPHENEFHIFDEYYISHETQEETLKTALETVPNEQNPYPKPELAAPDPSALELAKRLWSKEIDTVTRRHRVEDGVARLQNVLQERRPGGLPTFLVHPRCARFRDEMTVYSRDKKGVIIKANDHGPDAARYFVWNRYTVGLEDDQAAEKERKAKQDRQLEVQKVIAEGRATSPPTPKGAPPQTAPAPRKRR